MSFDLDYVMVDCDHRIHDILIQEAVSPEIFVADGASVCGSSLCGSTVDTVGQASYATSNLFGTKGTFTKLGNGNTQAVIDIDIQPASNIRLFVRKPGEYQRYEVFPTGYTESLINAVYGDGLVYGNFIYDAPSLYEDVTENTETLWEMDYRNSQLTIYRYDNMFDWYIDYNVGLTDCPFCKGSGVENDLVVNNIGRMSLAVDTDKLVQTVMKAVLTEKGKNPYNPSYGTMIKSLIGQKFIMSGFLLRQEIMDQLEQIKKLQNAVMRAAPDFYSPYEVLYDIVGAQILPTSDPRQIDLKLVLKSLALDRVGTKTIKISAVGG